MAQIFKIIILSSLTLASYLQIPSMPSCLLWPAPLYVFCEPQLPALLGSHILVGHRE